MRPDAPSKSLTADQLESVVVTFSNSDQIFDFMERHLSLIKTPKDLATVSRLFSNNTLPWDPDWPKTYLSVCIPQCLEAEADLDTIITLLNSYHISRADNRARVIEKTAKKINNFDDLQNVLSKLVEPFLVEVIAELY